MRTGAPEWGKSKTNCAPPAAHLGVVGTSVTPEETVGRRIHAPRNKRRQKRPVFIRGTRILRANPEQNGSTGRSELEPARAFHLTRVFQLNPPPHRRAGSARLRRSRRWCRTGRGRLS